MKRWPGPGPVFAVEWLVAARRWQLYAMRSLFVLSLLIGLGIVWGADYVGPVGTGVRSSAQGRFAASVYYAVVGTQLALVLLAAPAATAGAICIDRARGTLAHLLVTDLSDAEIVLGKLAARLAPVLGLVACTFPVVVLCSLMGGIDPDATFGAYLVTVGVAVLGCALALTFSVWAGKTHEVLLATYLVWGAWLLFEPIYRTAVPAGRGWGLPEWLALLSPFELAFATYNRPGRVGTEHYLAFLAVALAVSAALAALATWKVRSVAAKQAGSAHSTKASGFARALRRTLPTLRRPGWLPGWPGPSLDRNPVLWREWHRTRPSRWSRAIWAVFGTITTGLTAVAVVQVVEQNGGKVFMAPWVNGLQYACGMLLVSVSAATALAEERARGSLDVLMATPLSTRSIVWGKWLGAFRGVWPLAVLPVFLSAVLAGYSGTWGHVFATLAYILAYGAAVTSVGLALATWISRLGRAVALTVSFHVFMAAGWFLLVMMMSQGGPDNLVMSGSPFFGVGAMTAAQTDLGGPKRFLSAGILWTVLYAIGAGALLGLVLRTFERRLGRMPENGFRPAPFPPRVPVGHKEKGVVWLEESVG